MKNPILTLLIIAIVCCVPAYAQLVPPTGNVVGLGIGFGGGGGVIVNTYTLDPEITEIQYTPPSEGASETVSYYGTERSLNGDARQKLLFQHDVTNGRLKKYDSGSMMSGGLVSIQTPEGIDATQILSPESALFVASSVQPAVTSYTDGVIRSSSVPGYSEYTGTLDGYTPNDSGNSETTEISLDENLIVDFDEVVHHLGNMVLSAMLAVLGLCVGIFALVSVVALLRRMMGGKNG